MAFQPLEEPSDLQNICDFLQNDVQNPWTAINFSSITDTVSNSAADAIGTERNLSISSDSVDELEAQFKDVESSFKPESYDELDVFLTKQLDECELEAIDRSIEDRQMSVDIQPPTDIRRRYETDGKRQIERSRSAPMAIKLPNFETCKLNSNISLWLQLNLVTTNQNPANIVYIHEDKLEYHADDVSVPDNGSVRIPLTPDDIREKIKQLARISIIKKKLDSYTFQLIPFNPLSTNTIVTTYDNGITKSIVPKAKSFRRIYNLSLSRIVCRLLMKQNDAWRMTDIVCETNIMEEKKQTDDKTSNKRSASSDIHDDQVHQRSSAKKRKQLP